MLKDSIKFRLSQHLPFVGALFALGFWLLDVLVDALLFGEGTIREQLLHPEPMEIYFRAFVGVLFVVFGVYAYRLIKQQQRLKAENQLKAGILDMVSEGVALHDFEGRFIYVNEAFAAVRGYARQEVMGLNLFQVTAPRTRELIRSRLEKMRQTGGMSFESETLGKDGVTTLVEVNSRVINLDGRPAVLSIVRDIASQKEREQNREKLVKELQAALGKIKTLNGLIPICSSCKKIRKDDGYWQQVEDFVREHTDAEFSFGLCDRCLEELYPEFSGPGKKGG